MLAEEAFEGIESSFPEDAILGDPVFRGFEGSRSEPAEARPSDLFLGDQACVFEDAEMLNHRGKGHAVRPGKVGDGSFAEHEGGEDGAASGVGEGAEGGIEGLRILNHMV